MTSEVRPGATTVASWGGRAGAIILLLPAAAAAFDFGSGLGHLRGPAAVIYLAAVASVSAGWLYRAWGLGTRFDEHGITVRTFFRTRRFGWPEVSHFADGGWIHDGDEQRWALSIVLRDGRAVTTDATSSGNRTASPAMLAAIGQAAARYHIPAGLTGEAVTGQRPLGLHPDPGGRPRSGRRFPGRSSSGTAPVPGPGGPGHALPS